MQPTNTCPGTSICPSNNNENVAKPTPSLRVCYSVDLADRQNKCSPTEPRATSNSVHDTGRQVDDEDSDSDNSSDELLYSPAWYRFGAGATTTDGTNTIPDARSRYVAQVKDAFRDREFHNIIGKEYLDGEDYYLVEWVPTLVRASILRKAQAQTLVNRFEARCQNQKKNEAETRRGTAKRRRRETTEEKRRPA